ncbi:ATP-binding protein [Streptomyces sp. MK7]|uniref:ATP-binding protein n=1 Tax=Streptomyces sp. MK7 TaxID=3067635 RepID=UPI00292DDCED|nr:ATP-binding protein [Streptomyces sp. MK7]
MSVSAISACLPTTPVDWPATHPTPETLRYSLTLPAAPRTPAIARATTRTVLRAHGLADMTDPAVQVASELAASAHRFTTSPEVCFCIRYRDDALRVVLYDAHPRHTHPRLAAACDARRRSSLRLPACVVRACGGDWGFGDAREPGGGTRTWAVLPREGATAYLARVHTSV